MANCSVQCEIKAERRLYNFLILENQRKQRETRDFNLRPLPHDNKTPDNSSFILQLALTQEISC